LYANGGARRQSGLLIDLKLGTCEGGVGHNLRSDIGGDDTGGNTLKKGRRA